MLFIINVQINALRMKRARYAGGGTMSEVVHKMEGGICGKYQMNLYR